MAILATLGGKIGAGVLTMLLAVGAVWAYNERLISKGVQQEKEESLIRALEQERKETVRLREKEKSRLEIVEQTAAERNAANAQFLQAKQRADQLQRKVRVLETKEPEVRYETAYVEVEKVVEIEKPCLVDARSIEHLNDAIGVFNGAVAHYRVEGAGGASEESPVPDPAPIACDQIPDLTRELIAQLTNTSISHRGLSAYVVDQYQKDLAAKEEDQ
jgi:glutamine synthetase type III